jgi:hypothetical protein
MPPWARVSRLLVQLLLLVLDLPDLGLHLFGEAVALGQRLLQLSLFSRQLWVARGKCYNLNFLPKNVRFCELM